MERIHIKTSRTSIAFITAAGLFVACGGPEPLPDPEAGVVPFISYNPTRTELNCAINEYLGHVHYGTKDRHDTLKMDTIQFTVKSFQKLALSYAIDCGKVPGLVIHYGYDETLNAPTMAFSFVCMDLTYDKGPYSHIEKAFYTLSKDHEFVDTVYADLDAWYSGPGKTFQDSIVVDQFDKMEFTPMYQHYFPHMVYKLSQVNKLIIDNGLGEMDKVEVVPIAEPNVWVEDHGLGFSMHTCLVAKDASGRLILDEDLVTGAPYRNRGSDLGSPCPVACGDYAVFLSKGVDIRSTCKP